VPTFTAIADHIVFSTQDRAPVLCPPKSRSDLFRYIWEIIRNRDGHLYRINGVKTTFEEEYRKLLADAGIEFDERYFF
jgi:hypothetical protein